MRWASSEMDTPRGVGWLIGPVQFYLQSGKRSPLPFETSSPPSSTSIYIATHHGEEAFHLVVRLVAILRDLSGASSTVGPILNIRRVADNLPLLVGSRSNKDSQEGLSCSH